MCHINDVASICRLGIFSHNAAKKRAFNPTSICDPAIQQRRERVVVPGVNKRLHDYANLYFNARNPMMFKLSGMHQDLCVLSIKPEVMDVDGVILTDGNAASDYRVFCEAGWGLAGLDEDRIYARDWTHPDQFEYWRRKRAICAEVLVPDKVETKFIQKIYVSCDSTRDKLLALVQHVASGISLEINPDLFFLL